MGTVFDVVNGDIVFDVVNPFTTKGSPLTNKIVWC